MKKKNVFRRHIYKFVVVMLVLFIGVVAAKIVNKKNESFVLANDCPRGALVYAQFADLPAIIKRWNESKLKADYLESTNFKEFSHGHLALKLLERWDEFNSALGFSMDTSALAGATEKKAAIALYDVGKLDAVFIAPIASEKIAQTIFHQNKDTFEEIVLPDETTYYSLLFEADRGRLQQKILFAAANGRFILATNETLLLRTLANINGKSKKDSLADEPAFSVLSKIVSPHDATIWVDQTKLNQDLYFKNYWLMSGVDQLKTIRAGMFDLEIRDERWIERREFLATKQKEHAAISSQEIEQLRAMIPTDVPFLKLKTFGGEINEAASLINKTLFDALPENRKREKNRWDSYSTYHSDDDYDYDSGYNYYSSVDGEFDQKIDDDYEAGAVNLSENEKESKEGVMNSLQNSIQRAQPVYAAFMANPQTLEEPFFAEFNRVSIIKSRQPGAFSAQSFEQAILKMVENNVLIQNSSSNLQWITAQQKEQTWRELSLPMLGWKLCYKLNGNDLIVANNREMIFETLGTKKDAAYKNEKSSLNALTIIQFDKRQTAFDEIMETLQEADTDAFFYGNIASLLDVFSDVNKIEIRRKTTAKGFSEEIKIVLKNKKGQ